jgi:putative hemolysin
MIVSNHPLGGLDGIILIEIFGSIFKEVRFVVNDLLYHIDPLKPVFIPVNKYGRQSTDVAKMMHDNYTSDAQILYFPAGLCSRLIDGRIEDLEWKRSYINQAIKYKRDILPVYFEGRNSGFFYRVANLRKRLGIKFNYETILLPHEMFRNKNSNFNIYISKPVSYEELVQEKDIRKINKKIREAVYSLKQ